MTYPLTVHARQGWADGRPGETPSLEETGQLWSQASSGGYKPTSVLGQYRLSPENSRSQEAAQRVLPDGRTTLPSNNASSSETSEAQVPLRMVGDLPL